MTSIKNALQLVRADDFVEYYLFPSIDSRDEKDQETTLNTVLQKANKIVEKYAKNYLWHKDAFKLTIRTSHSNYLRHIEDKNDILPPHLYGVSHYGDNIEDEWFMVFILRELTREVTGTIGRIYDSDGEFLLIEAADFLPNWANPDTCENRVYFYDGKLHLIPPEDPENPSISISTALSMIWADPGIFLTSDEIQNSIKNKLSNFPDNIKDNLHCTTILVPTMVAAILRHRPSLIAPAVQAFCNRDPLDLKACRAMKYFPPEQRVRTRVTFTKCLYAMLLHSKYVPDRRTGWNLLPVGDPEYKTHVLGVKVACGFEILVSQAKPSDDVEGDKGWHTYLENLKEKGYFKGFLEHSRDYNNLLNRAKEYYADYRDSMHYCPAIGQEVLSLLKSIDINFEQFQSEGDNLEKDDDDSWLNISPEELDRMLQEKYGQRKMFSATNDSDAGTFAEKVNAFLSHVSDVEGAEFPESSPVKPARRKNKNKVSFSSDAKEKENSNNKVNFDPNSFACAVQNILNFVIPEDDSWDLDSGSDMSEYENDDYVNTETCEDVKNKMETYMDEMDKELAATTIGQSFEKKNDDGFEDIENFKPVDIDMNALKNILESYRSQIGEAGPSSNMLGPMGVHLNPK
ncbi:protein ecdysoneless [Cylas formicarius]|uniref:protein ecdysoneless n=1 Tax=Cylas formicarius TaxID=197179 RepID=UPI002958C62A|nr:protein ecdysoneless [Cylas formicarius]